MATFVDDCVCAAYGGGTPGGALSAAFVWLPFCCCVCVDGTGESENVPCD